MSSAIALLELEPQSVVALIDEDAELRKQYFHAGTDSRAASVSGPVVADVLSRSAALLELVLASACLREVLGELSLNSLGGAQDRAQEIEARVRQCSGLDPRSVIPVALQLFPEWAKAAQALGPTPPPIPLSALLEAVRGFLAGCPINWLTATARTIGSERIGHRCQVAFDGLTAFVFRNSSRGQDDVRLLGRAYAAGTISVSEIARILSVQRVDVVAALERSGFQRPIETILLEPDGRQEILARIRRDRGQRGDSVPYSAAFVRRDAIASERIEGVDARQWLAEDL